MKKIKVTVSDFMNEIITGDSEYFKLLVGKDREYNFYIIGIKI